MRVKSLVLVFSVALLLTTCTKDIYAPSACFQEKILPIFVSNCTQSGCHNAIDKKEGLDLSNYEGIMQGVKAKHPLQSEVYKEIRGNNPSMPAAPYKKLSAEQVNLIKLWINAGAPNSSNCTSCDSSSFAYASRVSVIMQTWCVGCHNSSNAGGSINLSDYAGVVNAANNNRLLGSIFHSAGFKAMPQNAAKLSSCDIRAIEKWIINGMPNN